MDIGKYFDGLSNIIDNWDSNNYFMYALLIIAGIIIYLVFF